MADMTDILTDPETGEVICRQGDLVTGESTRLHQNDLLLACEGEYKQFPTTGVGLIHFIDDDEAANLMRKIRQQFSADGMNVTRSTMTEAGKLTLEAQYK